MQNQSFVKLDSLAYIIVWWQNYVLMVLFVSCLKPCTWYMLVVTSKSYIIIWGHSPANAKVIACVAWCVRSVLLIRHVQLALSFSDQGLPALQGIVVLNSINTMRMVLVTESVFKCNQYCPKVCLKNLKQKSPMLKLKSFYELAILKWFEIILNTSPTEVLLKTFSNF